LKLRTRLEWMASFLHVYISDDPKYGKSANGSRWMASSLLAAHTQQKMSKHAEKLRKWTKAFICDRDALPISPTGKKTQSRILDEDIAADIAAHLQGIGQYVRALDIVQYTAIPEVRQRLGIKKTVSLATARRWMKTMGYRWTKKPSGQYVDGHERDDVVYYRQNVFLPAWAELDRRTRKWTTDNTEIINDALANGRTVVIWFHDESTFYANDRRIVRWVHKSEKAVPRAKGEGASLMVADFISADYGWLTSPDKTKYTRVLFKAGKARDGYFTNDDIISHATSAMDLLDKHYPEEEHVLVFDNATTHLKREDDALSAQKMPMKTPKEGRNWGIKVNEMDEDGNLVHGTDGKVLKVRVNMGDAKFADGSPQKLYFPAGHERASIFKGMAMLLQEHGFDTSKLRAQCKEFKCKKDTTMCCCRRILYTQPDFVNVLSILERVCNRCGYRVLFLPKFHCELNFIEQCWGYSKRLYRQYPVSSKEADLETNVLTALDSVPINVMQW